jgi:hypothetical protein
MTPEYWGRASKFHQADPNRWATAEEVPPDDRALISMLESETRQPTRDSTAKLCAGLVLAHHERDELYIAAGFIPPDLDAELLGTMVYSIRLQQVADAV